MNQTKLPADPNAMVLGIVALVLALTGCCCGLLAVVGLVLSIIGLISANKSLRDYTYNPENYFPNSRSNVSTAKVLNIIALIINSIVTLIMTIYFVFYGALVSTAIMEGIRESESGGWETHEETEYYYDESEPEDSIFLQEEDTLFQYQDSLQVE